MIIHRIFHSFWLLSLFVLIGFTLLCTLGVWQLDRAWQKQRLLDQNQQATALPPLSTQDLFLSEAQLMPLRFRTVKLTQPVLNQYTILLDNKINKGRTGYEVIVPLLLDEETYILINRGWIPAPRSREIYPVITPMLNNVTIEGYLDFAYRNSLISNAIETSTITWPLRMQQLDLTLLASLLGKKINPMLVILNSHSPDAFDPPQTVSSPALWIKRHYGYAFQWFALAATLLGFYFFTAFKAKDRV